MYLDLLIQKNLDFLEDIFVLNINIYICYPICMVQICNPYNIE